MIRHSCNKTFLDVVDNDSFAIGILYINDGGKFSISAVLPAENATCIKEKYGLHDVKSRSVPESRKCLKLITGIVFGKNDSAPLIGLLDMNGISPFAERILTTLALEVTRGKIVTYSGLARLAGADKSARAVGAVMRTNPFPLIFPCHRVVAADMSLHGYSCGLSLKEKLLVLEEIPVSKGFVSGEYALKC